MEHVSDVERRRALADFLRTRRARLAPGDVALPPGLRRRTQGLRREEVAQLAHIGVSWYTALEQGRDVHPSEQVLESVARALKLTADERRHLWALTTPQPVPHPALQDAQPSLALRRLVETRDPHPAYVINRYYDLVLWNAAAEAVFSFSAIKPPHTRNLVWRAFTDPELREGNAAWERLARGMVAQLRAASARYPGDASIHVLIDDLERTDAAFAGWWQAHDVLSVPHCHKAFQHPRLGYVEFEQITLQDTATADLQLVMYTAAAPATASVVAEAIRRIAAASPREMWASDLLPD